MIVPPAETGGELLTLATRQAVAIPIRFRERPQDARVER